MVAAGGLLAAMLAFFAWDSRRGAPLEAWHKYLPKDTGASEINDMTWGDYLAAEDTLFRQVHDAVTARLATRDQLPFNRYFEGSPVYPGRFTTDWNRSYSLEPAGPPQGVVVLLHGLTDSPYSLRHLGRLYRDRGWVVLAIRLPGHGTVPSGLSYVKWESWLAATHLAVREARRRVPTPAPLHIVGFSNGGALALQYSLDAIDDSTLARADRMVLITPMIGITAMARFAGIAGWPSILPWFAKAAWLGIVPEFNPFKYNSFPVNGAVQSHQLTRALQGRIAEYAARGRLDALPPVLTFQSVVDFTVSAPAIVSALYDHLPANGSALVLFDINRSVDFGPVLRATAGQAADRLVPPPPRRYGVTLVTNAGPGLPQMVAEDTPAGSTGTFRRALDLAYPRTVFSLSHVALPFPVSDPMLGMEPDTTEDYGIRLGTLALRGEVDVLVLNTETLMRLTSNPFFPYLEERVVEWMER
jgi:alpha-beta hydrolase superfamily lysophospholipase